MACLCAAWCRLCDDYAAVFRTITDRLARERPGLEARWIDIEDEAAVLGDLDVETFPTLLVRSAAGVLFAGVLEPHGQTLERVLRACLADPVSTPVDPAFEALGDRLWSALMR